MAVVEREPSLPKVVIDLSTHQFSSDGVTTTFREGIRWRILLLLARNPLQKIPIEEFSKVILQARGRDFDHPYKSIDSLRKLIDPDNGRPLIATIRGSRRGGQEVLGYSFLADVNLIGQEQSDLPKKAELSLPGMDAEEFSRLYERQIDETKKYIYYRVGNYHDAEDLAHEVYYRAWRANARGFYQPHGPVSWINQITHNSLVNHYRAKKQPTSLEGMDIPASDSSDPALLAERQFENDHLQWAVSKLKRDQQRVVRARFIYEMEHEEIAKMMGKSEGSVKVMLHRALLALRGVLKDEPIFVGL